MTSESKVEGIDDSGLRNNRGVIIIKGSVDLVVTGECIGGGELGTRENFPDDVEVL